MLFRDGSDKGTASVHQILCRYRKNSTETLPMIRKAFGEESMSRIRKVQNQRDRKRRDWERTKSIAFYSFMVNVWKCEKTLSPNFCEIITGCCTKPTEPSHTFFVSRECLTKNNMAVASQPPYFSRFPRFKIKLKGYHFIQLRWSRLCWTPSLNTISRMHSRNGRSVGNGAFARKGTTSRGIVSRKPKVSSLTTWQHKSRRLWIKFRNRGSKIRTYFFVIAQHLPKPRY
jgi:hypothetical protein